MDFAHKTNLTNNAEIAEIIQKMVIEIRKKKFETIIVNGSSAQSVAYVMKVIWKKFYPKEKMPRFFALGLQPRKIQTKSLFDHNVGAKYDPKNAQTELIKLIQENMPSLKKRINTNTLLLDDCYHSGETYRATKAILEKIGFKKITPAIVISNEKLPKKTILGLKRNGCLLFQGNRREAIGRALRERSDLYWIKKFPGAFEERRTQHGKNALKEHHELLQKVASFAKKPSILQKIKTKLPR